MEACVRGEQAAGRVGREGRVGWRFGERCTGTASMKMKEFELNACWL